MYIDDLDSNAVPMNFSVRSADIPISSILALASVSFVKDGLKVGEGLVSAELLSVCLLQKENSGENIPVLRFIEYQKRS